jgi:phage terminase large subunit
MREMASGERIRRVDWDKALGVVTAWDLGVGDSTAIVFAQYTGTEVRIIDHYEASGVGLDHYVSVLNAKPYNYEQHVLPHDVRVRELGTGKSRLETLDALGVRNIVIAPQLGVDDGIQAVRSMLNRCWMDEDRCDRLIDAMRQYRRDYDESNRAFRSRPLHDWTSHSADAMRYLAVGYKPLSASWKDPIRRNLKGVA